MKKIILVIMLCGFFRPLFSFFPYFYGARSLALGYSSLAFNYDFNAAYLNPALLNSLTTSLGGFQYQSSFLDYRDVSDRLAAISVYDLKNFRDLDAETQANLQAELKDVFSATTGISGFQIRNLGYAGKGYALTVAHVDAAIAYPLENSVLDKAVGEITNADIAALQMRFIGFHYTDYSLSFAFPISQGLAVGATIHYLKGQNTEFTASITAKPFQSDADTKDLLQFAWSGAENDFSKLNFDLGVSAEFGQYFKAGLIVKNVANPVIATELSELRLARRLIAGLAFRPDSQLGLYLDIDVAKNDLFHNGQNSQPVSIGVEKGLFQNKLFLRAGFLSDLNAKYFLGRKANVLYGMGFGFNLGNFLVDLALGLDPLGRVKNLGISGFYLIK
jgi:hypothetical protein